MSIAGYPFNHPRVLVRGNYHYNSMQGQHSAAAPTTPQGGSLQWWPQTCVPVAAADDPNAPSTYAAAAATPESPGKLNMETTSLSEQYLMLLGDHSFISYKPCSRTKPLSAAKL